MSFLMQAPPPSVSPQIIASNPEISCFVMASAGTGKTKMLIDRLLRLLFKGYSFSSILCLTFTKAAAEEMKQRLMDRASLLLNMDDQELETYFISLNIENSNQSKAIAKTLFFNLLNEQHALKIQTIHSFCQNILEANAWVLSFIPPFSILEEVDQKKRILKSLEHVSQDQAFKDAFNFLTSRMSLSQFLNYLYDAISLDEKMLQKAMEPLSYLTQKKSIDLKPLLEQLPPDLLDNLLENNSSLESVFLTKEGTARKKIFKKDLLKKYEVLEDLSQTIATHFEELFDQKKQQHLEALNFAFFNIAKAVKNNYQRTKIEHSILDFDDLIRLTNDIFKTSSFPEIEQRLGYKIKSILVDEAQDTSPLQWEIISELIQNMLLCDEKNEASLLIVGDIKQAIYSFQGADPHLFLKKQDDFKKLFNHHQKSFEMLSLETSYRCLDRVLTSVDHYFNTYSSGLYLNDKPLKHTPFRKGKSLVTVFDIDEGEGEENHSNA
ncbi:MAG: UvrD-helicase domain-containing protein, partial [Proteobacteria bacterium]|nr:UvrD-helicase domain-containing protein [Pseudomonadota bacterium]